ncbi:hypothetical protein NKH18_43495 [Streptomyces sp. M10(2022)]
MTDQTDGPIETGTGAGAGRGRGPWGDQDMAPQLRGPSHGAPARCQGNDPAGP